MHNARVQYVKHVQYGAHAHAHDMCMCMSHVHVACAHLEHAVGSANEQLHLRGELLRRSRAAVTRALWQVGHQRRALHRVLARAALRRAQPRRRTCGAQLPGRRLLGAVGQRGAPHRASERCIERRVSALRLHAQLRRGLGERARQREATAEDVLSREGVGVLGHGRVGAARIAAAAIDGRPAERDARRAGVCTQPRHRGKECEVLPCGDQAGVSDDVAVEVRVEHLGEIGGVGARLAAVVAVRVGRIDEVVDQGGMC